MVQIASGRLKRATSASLHLIGAAAEFVGPPIGSRKSTNAAEKARMLCGARLFEERQLQL